jgi:hypothetical protein
MEPEAAEKDYEQQKWEDEHFHTDLLCCCILDVLTLEHMTRETRILRWALLVLEDTLCHIPVTTRLLPFLGAWEPNFLAWIHARPP